MTGYFISFGGMTLFAMFCAGVDWLNERRSRQVQGDLFDSRSDVRVRVRR